MYLNIRKTVLLADLIKKKNNMFLYHEEDFFAIHERIYTDGVVYELLTTRKGKLTSARTGSIH